MESRKDGTGSDGDTENHLWTQRGRRRVGQIESAAWKHLIADAKLPDGNSLYDTGAQNQSSVTATGWGGGRGFKRKGTYVCLP